MLTGRESIFHGFGLARPGMPAAMDFADRQVEARKQKRTPLVLGIDPQLERAESRGLSTQAGMTEFCCGVIEAARGSRSPSDR